MPVTFTRVSPSVGPQLGLIELIAPTPTVSYSSPVRVYCCPLRLTSSAPSAVVGEYGERHTSPSVPSLEALTIRPPSEPVHAGDGTGRAPVAKSVHGGSAGVALCGKRQKGAWP